MALNLSLTGRKQIQFLKEQLQESHKLNTSLSNDLASANKKIKSLEEDLALAVASLNTAYMTRSKYTEEDIIHNRRCLTGSTCGSSLRRIVEIANDWTLFIENHDGVTSEVPGMLLEYKRSLGKKCLSKNDLFNYMVSKRYILEDLD